MPKSTEFNEATYAQHLNNEITEAFRSLGPPGLDSVPLLPTPRDEADLGYDLGVTARWGMYYFQYKVPQLLWTRGASQSPPMVPPFYRFQVKSDVTSNGCIQHNVLVELEQVRKTEVFYASPAFYTNNAFRRHVFAGTVCDYSVFVKPSLLGMIGEGDRHVFAYDTGRPYTVRAFSQPSQPSRAGFNEAVASTISSLIDSEPESLDSFLSRQLEGLSRSIDIASQNQIEATGPEDEVDYQKIATALSTPLPDELFSLPAEQFPVGGDEPTEETPTATRLVVRAAELSLQPVLVAMRQ
ncbi:hypothetical protein [Gordonia malaquae]|uniref:hypothetical protein n=1 Tax=Gordonia malaquae TaxID=410332 RepID=UPI003017FFFC